MTQLPDPEIYPELYDGVPVKRLIAWAVDMVVTLGLCLLALPFTLSMGLFAFPFLFLVVGFGYRVMALSNFSATFGMRLMAIEMRDEHDQRFDLNLSMLHTAGFSVSLLVPVLLLISSVFMATSPLGQGLSDLALKATALNNRRVC